MLVFVLIYKALAQPLAVIVSFDFQLATRGVLVISACNKVKRERSEIDIKTKCTRIIDQSNDNGTLDDYSRIAASSAK